MALSRGCIFESLDLSKVCHPDSTQTNKIRIFVKEGGEASYQNFILKLPR